MRKNIKWINYLPYLLVSITLFAILYMEPGSSVEKLNYDELQTVIEQQEIVESTATFGTNVISIKGYYMEGENKVNFTATMPRTEELANEVTSQLGEANIIDETASNVFVDALLSIVPFLIIGGFVMFMLTKMNGGQNNKAFEFSKSRARLEGDIKVRFNDVAGCDEEKEEMAEIIDYLKSPKKFAKMGARIPKGILMVGSPGTGKTLLAKAVAGEADVPFYSISGSDFVEMFVGVGASRVRDMFKKAKQTAPCMIFIDEIDAVGRQRGAGMGGGHDEREQTLNQMLVEMDGITDNGGIVIIAATNRPDVLDPALLRPGRFDRTITVSLPDKKGRKAILKVHARNKSLADEINLDALASRTPGFSGADLENVLNEASILAVRDNSTKVYMHHLDEAIDRVMMGPAKKSRKYDEKSKKLVAYHEAGHAIIGLNVDSANKVQKVTIIPRGTAGGYNLMIPKEEKIMNTKNDLLSMITGYMGGRCAEEVFFDDVSTGAINDIEQATKLARDMVTIYGMSDLGPIKYDNSDHSVFLGRDYNSGSGSSVSGQIAFEIDQEVRKIIDMCHTGAKKLIVKHREDLILIAEALIEHETLTAEEIELVLKGEFKPFDESTMEKNVVETVVENVEVTEAVTEEISKEEPKI